MPSLEGVCHLWKECAISGRSVPSLEGVCHLWKECAISRRSGSSLEGVGHLQKWKVTYLVKNENIFAYLEKEVQAITTWLTNHR